MTVQRVQSIGYVREQFLEIIARNTVEQIVGVAVILRNMAILNSGEHTGNNFSESYPPFGREP